MVLRLAIRRFLYSALATAGFAAGFALAGVFFAAVFGAAALRAGALTAALGVGVLVDSF